MSSFSFVKKNGTAYVTGDHLFSYGSESNVKIPTQIFSAFPNIKECYTPTRTCLAYDSYRQYYVNTTKYGYPFSFAIDTSNNLYGYGGLYDSGYGRGGVMYYYNNNANTRNYTWEFDGNGVSLGIKAQMVKPSFNYTNLIKTDGTLWVTGLHGSHLGIGNPYTQPTYYYEFQQVGNDHDWKYVTNCSFDWYNFPGYNNLDLVLNDYTYPYQWGGCVLPKHSGFGVTFGVKNGGDAYACGELNSVGLGNENSNTMTLITQNVKKVACTPSIWLVMKGNLPNGESVYTSNSDKKQFTDTAPYAHCVFLKNDGTLWGSGNNTYGQLGLGSNADQKIIGLTRIGSDSDWVDVSCGMFFTVAIKADGTLWSTGKNDNGTLGLGDTTDRNVFTQVGYRKTWKRCECIERSTKVW